MLYCICISLAGAANELLTFKQSVLSVWFVSLCVSQSSKFWADHDNEGSKYFSTSLNQWKYSVHGVPEGG